MVALGRCVEERSATRRFTREEIVLEPATRAKADAAAFLLYDTDPHLLGYFFGRDHELALRYFAAQWRQSGASSAIATARWRSLAALYWGSSSATMPRPKRTLRGIQAGTRGRF